jgi:hypothetical protein
MRTRVDGQTRLVGDNVELPSQGTMSMWFRADVVQGEFTTIVVFVSNNSHIYTINSSRSNDSTCFC